MIASWNIEFKTGRDLSNNDRYRIRELIAESISDIASTYAADVNVQPGHFIPSPVYGQFEPSPGIVYFDKKSDDGAQS